MHAASFAVLSIVISSSVPADSTSEVAGLDVITERLGSLFRAADDILERAPPSIVDTETLQRALGDDATTLHRWVHEHTRQVDYPGALKGAEATLLASQGNALDRSLLLASLLQHAGHDVEIAWTERIEPSLHALYRSASAQPPLPDETLTPTSPTSLASTLDRPLADVLADIDRRDRAAMQRQDAFESLVDSHASTLQAVLDAHDHALPTSIDTPTTGMHYWVKARRGGDTWLHYDPLQPGVPDSALIVDHASASLADLPPELFHAITIDVLVGVADADGAITEHTVLSQRLNTAAMAEDEGLVMFAANPATELEALLGTFGSSEPAFWRDELLKQTIWSPAILFRDADPIFQRAFRRDGTVLDNPPGLFSAASEQASEAADTLASLPSDETAAPAPGDGAIASVTLRWTTERPDAPPRIVTRPLYQRDKSLSQDEQQLALALAMMSRHTFIVQRGAVPDAHVAHLRAALLKRMRLPLTYLTRPSDKPVAARQEELARLFERLWTVPMEPLVFASRRRLDGQDVFIAEPNVIVETELATLDSSEGLVFSAHLDIVANRVVGKPAAVFTHGIMDAVLESQHHEGDAISTVSLLANVPAERLRLVDRNSADVELPDASGNGAVMQAELDAGFTLLLPVDADHPVVGWWRFDPTDANLVGQLGDHGRVRGGTSVEEGLGIWYYLNVTVAFMDAGKAIGSCEPGGEAGCYVCAAVKVIAELLSENDAVGEAIDFGGNFIGLTC